MANFKLAFQDLEKDFAVTRQGAVIRVVMDGNPVECHVQLREDSSFIIETVSPDGTRHLIRAAGSANGDSRQLWVDGQIVDYRRVRRQRAANIEGSLSTTIPAIVAQILVKEGDDVAAGEKLMLLESMKMIIPIQAPFEGTVTGINCQEGESVAAGVQLIDLAKKGDADE